ncbi:MAG: divalent-cation tolerance protein CutA [candidate division KSB1 bacterium]|nr:divalent-cation tolerance protein CutA [candidate division KSB1 bacterium]
MDYCITLVTFPNCEEADKISAALVDQKLAACANRIDTVTSFFRWQNKVEHEQEILVVYKTRATRLNALIETVKELHSYEVPEVIALPILAGSDDYLQWIKDETQIT